MAVCVYNRFENINRWINCWKQSQTGNAELVIVHNYYGDQAELEKYKNYCEENSVKYVPRNTNGYDIGAFQDVCRERLTGFPDFDFLLWCCDDTIPMQKDFIKPFVEKLTDTVGVVCMDLSPYVRTHIRTTGFLIRKETAQRLTFSVDPITTKEDCYRFEHRDPWTWFYKQVIDMNLDVVQVAPREKSPLWDAGYHRGLKRQAEHNKIFPPVKPSPEKVVFICPIFDAFPEIISSLMCQTYKNWHLLLIDDNPETTICAGIIAAVNDPRITYIKRPREANYGHPQRAWALQNLDALSPGAAFVVITNGDNYYTPPFLEYMMEGFYNNSNAVAAYASDMVHSYLKWITQPCKLARGHVDCGGVMIRKSVACETGWRSMDHSSDWFYFDTIIRKYGADKWVKVRGTLFVHN